MSKSETLDASEVAIRLKGGSHLYGVWLFARLTPMGYFTPVNWHEVIDERNFEMDYVIADILRAAPEKLRLAQAWVERKLADPKYSDQNKESLREWLDVIETGGVEGVLAVLMSRSDESERLRQSAPFSMLMPDDQRRAILEKYEPFRTRTPASRI